MALFWNHWLLCISFIIAISNSSSTLVIEDEGVIVRSILDKMIGRDDQVLKAVRNMNHTPVEVFEAANEKCVDQLSSNKCMFLKRHLACETSRDKMEIYCHNTCGFCGNAPACKKTQYGCCPDGENIAEGINNKGCIDECKDLKPVTYCRAIRRVGFCDRKGSPHVRMCLRTCGTCRVCVDKTPKACKTIWHYRLCDKFPYIANNRCRKTCRLCGKQDPCDQVQCKGKKRCTVNVDGKPICQCHQSCHRGDHFTGEVCGEDGKTYKNLCQLKQTHCDDGNGILVAYYGKCNDKVKRDIVHFPPWESSCKNSQYGCCKDGKTVAKGEKSKGCPPTSKIPACKDSSKRFCLRFIPSCGFGHNIAKMMHYCPHTCRYCV